MAGVRLVYLCERKGLPSLGAQRAAVAAAGLTADEIAAAYLDRITRRPRPGEAAQPQRAYLAPACRPGDEVWVPRLAVLAMAEAEALDFVIAITRYGAVLCDAATGERYAVQEAERAGVEAGLRLSRAIAADGRAAVMERARRGKAPGKTGGRTALPEARVRDVEPLWRDPQISEAEFRERTGIPGRTIRRYLGKRNTPAFGKALNDRRKK